MGKKQIWLSVKNFIMVVHKVDVDLYYYEFDRDNYILLEKSPAQFGMEFIGEL